MGKVKNFAKKHKKGIALLSIAGAGLAIGFCRSMRSAKATTTVTESVPRFRDTLVKPTEKLALLGFDGLTDSPDGYFESMNDGCSMLVKDLDKLKEAILELDHVTEESPLYILFNVTKVVVPEVVE